MTTTTTLTPSVSTGGGVDIADWRPEDETFWEQTGKRVAGIVHENEFVIPEFMLQNQTVADIAGVLEAIRTGKSRGFAQGGESSPRPRAVSPSPKERRAIVPAATDPAVLEALMAIKTELQKPKKNYVVLKDISEAQETMDFIKSKTDL